MKVAVVKYNAGNIRSVDYALKRLGVEAVITADKEELQSADKVIFPGVGEAETTMNHLKATGLDELIKNLRQPVLGICLGMQLMCRYSEEGEVDCLNILFRKGTKIRCRTWGGIQSAKRIANSLKDLPKKNLSTSCIAFMCRLATLLPLRLIIFIRLVLPCIKITFMPPSFIRRKAVRRERRF